MPIDGGHRTEDALSPSVVHPEFKADIVERCRPGDRSIGQVARDFELTGGQRGFEQGHVAAVRAVDGPADRECRAARPTDHFQPDFPRSVGFGPVPSPP
jgi:hypothetical protein